MSMDSMTQVDCGVDVNGLRAIVKDLIERQEIKSAVFMADKVVDLSDSDPSDVLVLAQCLYRLKEYHRAIHCIKIRKLHEKSLACRHLMAKCHFSAKEFNEALIVLSYGENATNSANGTTVTDFNITLTKDDDVFLCPEEMKWKSSIYLLRGQIFEALDNRSMAAGNFKKALKNDIYNYEAFQCLTQHQMLTRAEEDELLKLLKPEDKLIKFLYESLVKKYSRPNIVLDTSEIGEESTSNIYQELLFNNVDLMTARAEAMFYNCDYQSCYKLTTEVLSRDLYHTSCLSLHISCLMELKKTIELFELAHQLVNLYPESAISWYSVGCYYLMINKTESARRFLNKSTSLDPVFGPSWLLYGHSFAVESEHDQAMAAYFKASHLMKGCHLPLLYIGLEYGSTDNTKLAEKFFNQALLIAPNDPFVLHELAVISFQNQDFSKAESHSIRALEVIKNSKHIHLPQKWEPLLNNLGHIARKLKKYEEAHEYHRQAMVLLPQNASTYSAIGFVYMLQFKWNEAVEYFHKALGLKRDDPFSTTCLNQSIEHLISSTTPLLDEMPIYESVSHVSKVVDAKKKKSDDPSLSSASVTLKSASSSAQKETCDESNTLDDAEMIIDQS